MTEKPFDFFVILAEMRTGSNFLEANINEFASLRCLGEVFNPSFVGHKNQDALFGFTLPMREADPLALIAVMRERSDGLPGFRFFHDHDPRVLEYCLSNPRCAKVVLTRNPLESYVSLRIARETGQWKLTNVKHQRTARVRFDPLGFETHLETLQAFQVELMHTLQVTGQTAFYIDYEDITDVDVLNGLVSFLGSEEWVEGISDKLKKQNPAPTIDKVVNPTEMEGALARLDRFNLSRTPSFEPRRGAGVRGYFAGDEAGLLYMPVTGGPEAQVLSWLETIGAGLVGSFTQKALRQWKRRHVGHRSFTVLRHPVARAHAAYCTRVLSPGRANFRANLIRGYKLALPDGAPADGHDLEVHRRGFLAFLQFLKMNLAGQTGVRVDSAWATQASVLQDFSGFSCPDAVLHENRLAEGLAWLASEVGLKCPPLPPLAEEAPFDLIDLYDTEVEAAVHDAYQRDYMAFGFGPWKG